jgi:hypothetical protein
MLLRSVRREPVAKQPQPSHLDKSNCPLVPIIPDICITCTAGVTITGSWATSARNPFCGIERYLTAYTIGGKTTDLSAGSPFFIGVITDPSMSRSAAAELSVFFIDLAGETLPAEAAD